MIDMKQYSEMSKSCSANSLSSAIVKIDRLNKAIIVVNDNINNNEENMKINHQETLKMIGDLKAEMADVRSMMVTLNDKFNIVCDYLSVMQPSNKN